MKVMASQKRFLKSSYAIDVGPNNCFTLHTSVVHFISERLSQMHADQLKCVITGQKKQLYFLHF